MARRNLQALSDTEGTDKAAESAPMSVLETVSKHIPHLLPLIDHHDASQAVWPLTLQTHCVTLAGQAALQVVQSQDDVHPRHDLHVHADHLRRPRATGAAGAHAPGVL